MTDATPRRRVADEPLGVRMSVLEVEMQHLGRRFDVHLEASERVHSDLTQLMRKLDERDDFLDGRIDKLDLRLAGIAGAVGLAVFLATLFGPAIRVALGLP